MNTKNYNISGLELSVNDCDSKIVFTIKVNKYNYEGSVNKNNMYIELYNNIRYMIKHDNLLDHIKINNMGPYYNILLDVYGTSVKIIANGQYKMYVFNNDYERSAHIFV